MLEFFWLMFLSLVAALYGAIVPGPVFVITVSESLKRGRMAGPFVALGHLMVEAVLIFVVFLGLHEFLVSASVRASVRASVQMIVGIVGGVTLIIMGIYLAKASKNFQVDIKIQTNTKFLSHGPVIAGILGSCSNPQFLLWWLAPGIPLMYMSITVAGAIGFVAFVIGHAGADLGWFGFVSYSVDKGKGLLSKNLIRYIMLGSAIFLVIFGISFILSAYLAWI